MKHLLFLLDYYAPHKGGIENVFEQLIFRLLKKQYHITLLTSRFDESLPEKEVQGNLTIQRIGRERKSFFFQALRVGAKILREHPQIEVIHSSTYTSAIPASILGMLFSKKTLLTIHEIFGKLRTTFKPRYSRRIFQLFEWLTFQFPHDVYHCVSLYTLNSVRLVYGIPDEKLHLIYNGVDTDFWDAGEVSEERKRQLRKKF
ncbi:MAG: glycosyltransferase family 4 protein [Candidatus Peribacteria bacterium]|jgi:glycosyltransferase involved in cell wall biosynthesis|nr:glycosyltransferase family 4 protein [Candidatus Peribacteria bacterium]